MPSPMLRILASRSCAALCCLWTAGVAAQPADAPAAPSGPSTQDAAPSPPADAPPAETKPPAPPQSKFEGAIGLVLNYEPEFSGSSTFKIKPSLAGFLRYGRYTVTGAGGFTTRRQDDVERGLDAELVRRSSVKINAALRFDGGRKESTGSALAGMGDIRSTVRMRLGVRWDPAPNWQLSASTNADILGRDGGYTAQLGVARTVILSSSHRLILGAGVSGADARYLQTWYGVTEAQSAASGYPVYTPSAGLRDWGVGLTWRGEFDPDWAAFAGMSAGRLVGSAAGSPLVTKPGSWSLTAGIARRF